MIFASDDASALLLCWLVFASGATTTPFADVDSLVDSLSSCCETGISLTASIDMAYVCVASPSLSHSLSSRRRSEPAVEVEPCAASASPGAQALKRLDDLALDLVPFPPFSSVSPPAPWSAASCVLTPRCRHGRLVWRREGGRDPFGIQVEIPSWGPPRLNGSNPR